MARERFPVVLQYVACAGQYNKAKPLRGTLMRYFFSFPRPEAALASRIRVPAPARGTVAPGRSAQGVGPGQIGAALGTIDITAVALTTDNDLAVATGAVKQPGTGVHRHTKPMSAGV
jgi:hypothetical protein